MDTFLNIIAIIAIAVVAFLIIGFVGFRVPAPLRWPAGEPAEALPYLSPDGELAPLTKKWLFQKSSAAPVPTSLVAWGGGKMASRLPIFGKVWLPLSWTLYLIPGKCFILQNRMTWFGRRFIRGGEEYRAGKGIFILGSKISDTPYLDETERALMWLYSIWLAPATLVGMDSVSLVEMDENFLRLAVRDEDHHVIHQFDLGFDSATGLLYRISGTRKGSRTGEEYSYIASLSQPRNFENAGKIPTQYSANWDNDIYIKLDLAEVKMNQDISEALQKGVEELAPL